MTDKERVELINSIYSIRSDDNAANVYFLLEQLEIAQQENKELRETLIEIKTESLLGMLDRNIHCQFIHWTTLNALGMEIVPKRK
jgi:hypothetical protein